MEIDESKWKNQAIDNITKYLNRGGPCEGDKPQLLGGTELLNTIGMAMGLPMRDPIKWTENEFKRALNNDLVYFVGKSRKAIDAIADKIRYCCNGDSKNYVTVLPIELYFDGKLYELPLFRVKRYTYSQNYYVDNTGRTYDSYEDWNNNSKLPPCKMAYPLYLKLSLKSGCDYASVCIEDTPSARTGSQVARGVDTVAAVTGISSGVALLVVSGGLATPFVIAGASCAAWGTIRSGQQLIDKGTHGENLNPFTNSESRMLWLGVAANIISFGAMGASMRLASLAVRGRDISNAFRIFVNVANGTNVTVSGIAMLDTTIYLINHREDLSASDVLMHVASIAFWTKGLFTYKTAGTIIREAQNMAFTHLTQDLSPDEISNFTDLRNQFQNDARLLQEFYRAAEEQIPMKRFSQILLDAQSHGPLQFDSDGNLVLPGGQRYSMKFLNSISHNDRMQYFDIVKNLSPEQTEHFESFRKVVNDDMKLITVLARVAAHYDITPREATERVIHFWKTMNKMNLPGGTGIKINEGTLVIGRAPPINLGQLKQISPPMVRFIGEHLSQVDISSSSQWEPSIKVLLSLQSHGMFTECPVTRIVQSGHASILLNSQLKISIYTLNAIPSDDCRTIFAMVGRLTPTVLSSGLPDDLVKLCVRKYRLRFECQRTESVDWMETCVQGNNSLSRILTANLQNFEKDRLYMFHDTVLNAKADNYMVEMMRFVNEMRPSDVGTMVAYSEFVVAYVENERRRINQELKDKRRTLPSNCKKSEYLVTEAKKATFENLATLRQTLENHLKIVRANNMVGTEIVSKGLPGADLVAAIRAKEMKFANEISAAYHIFKHPVDPPGDYVRLANDTIRSPSGQYTVTLTQDGDARTVRFQSDGGVCIVRERDGRVILCTFMPM